MHLIAVWPPRLRTSTPTSPATAGGEIRSADLPSDWSSSTDRPRTGKGRVELRTAIAWTVDCFRI